MSTELNKAIVRRFYEEVFNQRDVNTIDELVEDEFNNNDSTSVAARDRVSMKQFIKPFTAVFPDHHHTIEDLIAEGDKVVIRCTLTATYQGRFPGFLETSSHQKPRTLSVGRRKDEMLAGSAFANL
jgi:predicted ester cyclase